MTDYTPAEAELAIRRAQSAHASPADAAILVDLFRRAAAKRANADAYEAQANALAAVLADILNGANPDEVASDLPEDARRRVLAYRHDSLFPAGVGAYDQRGKLPKVPPRAAVMRSRVRIVDVDPL